MRLARILLNRRWLFLAALLAGVITAALWQRLPSYLDAEQDSLCRRVIPALVDGARGISVTKSEAGDGNYVYIFFRVGDEARGHYVACHFAGSGLSFRKRVLVRIVHNGTSLGASATHFLTQGWLASQDSVVAEPRPAERRRLLPDVSASTGYGLQQILSALPRMGILALIAAAYALIYGLIGRINLAFGAFAALGGTGAALSVLLADALGLPALPAGPLAAIAGAGGLAALFGTVISRLVVAPMANRSGQHVLVASAGLMIALEEFLRLTQGARTLWLPPIFNAPITLARAPGFDVTLTPMMLVTAASAVVAGLALILFLARSRFGRQWRAVSDDALAAELFGISRLRVLSVSFALAAALAGFAGALVALHYGGIGFAGGSTLGLLALMAAILGGIGSVPGAMLGGCLIGALDAAWSAVLPGDWREVVMFAALSLVLVLKPDGLFSGRTPGPMRV